MKDGTYKKTNGVLVETNVDFGYWVALSETTQDEISEGEYLGVWTDPETGKTWYDKSVFLDDLTAALALAKTYNQIAIWDNANQAAINV